jgi:hypothetical protein
VDYARGRRTCLHILRASSPDLLQWSGRQLRSKATAEPPITLRNLERKSWKPVFLGKPEMWGGKVSGKENQRGPYRSEPVP